jgi:hypothetical protein
VRVASSIPDAVVTLEGASNGVNWKIPDWGRTKSDGTFVATGAFPPSIVPLAAAAALDAADPVAHDGCSAGKQSSHDGVAGNCRSEHAKMT